jgi:hypothetical protein
MAGSSLTAAGIVTAALQAGHFTVFPANFSGAESFLPQPEHCSDIAMAVILLRCDLSAERSSEFVLPSPDCQGRRVRWALSREA